MPDEKLPTGRIARMAKIGRATANVAVRQAGTKAANVVRSPEDSDKALERRQIETAEQIVTVLGGMKGAAMKVGQVLSFVDLGLVPEEYQEEFQAKLAALRDSAPTVSFEQMSKVIAEELGQPASQAFAELDPAPVAAASIGQVYRGRLHDGRDVAIKVQYPGVNDAVRADMQNLGMLMRLAKRITPQMDVEAVTREIRARIIEELDYELEASNHRTLARLYRGHPFIFIPPVVTEMCRERIIVTEFVEGDRFEQLTTSTQEERNRIGEIVFRFYFGSMYRHRRFSGDPHPGNMLRMADDKLAFLDFGLFKELGKREVEVELATGRAVTEKDAAELHRLWSAEGFLPQPERVDPDELMAYALDAIWWYAEDAEAQITREAVQRIAIQAGDPRSTHFRTMRHQDMNPEHLMGRRLELLVLAVLGELRATGNWHRIAREWMYGDEPVTELGKQEAEFLASRA
ncbi:MAG: AarF/ABC1/UbiB kinase family protein [Actinomycetota bacterium]|nr:AarF/ABC1/UbiB kinase family protein [Actinomycetota bacterium]